MFPVYVPGNVHRYYQCTITYTYTASSTRRGRTAPTYYIKGAKRSKSKIQQRSPDPQVLGTSTKDLENLSNQIE